MRSMRLTNTNRNFPTPKTLQTTRNLPFSKIPVNFKYFENLKFLAM